MLAMLRDNSRKPKGKKSRTWKCIPMGLSIGAVSQEREKKIHET